MPIYEFFNVTKPVEYIAHVEINRPDKLNAFHDPMWHELRAAFDCLSLDPDVRCVLLSGAGPKAFTAGTCNVDFEGSYITLSLSATNSAPPQA